MNPYQPTVRESIVVKSSTVEEVEVSTEDDNTIHLGCDEWDRVVEESKIQPVLVDIWAPWCESCGRAATYFKTNAMKNTDKPVTFIKFNVEKNRELCKELKLTKMPALRIVKDGTFVDYEIKPTHIKKVMLETLQKSVDHAVRL